MSKLGQCHYHEKTFKEHLPHKAFHVHIKKYILDNFI